MSLTQALATQLMENLVRVLDLDIEVSDPQGRVIVATRPVRVGAFDEVSFRAVDQSAGASPSYTQQDGVARVRIPLDWNRQRLGVLCVTGSPEQAAGSLPLVETILGLVLENELGGKEPAESRVLTDGFIKLLIAPHQAEGTLDNCPDALDTDADWVAIVFELFHKEDGQPLAPKHVAQVLFDFRSTSNRLFAEMVGDRQLVVLQRVDVGLRGWNRERTMERLRQYCERLDGYPWLGYYVSCGNYYPGIQRLSISYQSALETLAVGKRIKPGQKIFAYEELALDVLLRSARRDWTTEHLAAQYRRLASQDKNGCLQKTLEVLFNSNLNQGEAAKKLHIHRNTLRYRIDKINEVTGMDLNELEDILVLYASYKLHHINRE